MGDDQSVYSKARHATYSLQIVGSKISFRYDLLEYPYTEGWPLEDPILISPAILELSRALRIKTQMKIKRTLLSNDIKWQRVRFHRLRLSWYLFKLHNYAHMFIFQSNLVYYFRMKVESSTLSSFAFRWKKSFLCLHDLSAFSRNRDWLFLSCVLKSEVCLPMDSGLSILKYYLE